MCPGEVGLENWKMNLTWSRVKFRLQNRLTGFLLSTVGRGLVGIPLGLLGFAASVGHLSTLKTHPALSVSALGPWWRSARNSDLIVWVRVSVESSPKPLGNPSTAPKHPFLEVSLSPHDADFRCFRNKTAGFCLKACPGRNLSVCQTWIVASLRSFLRRLCIWGHKASKHWQ